MKVMKEQIKYLILYVFLSLFIVTSCGTVRLVALYDETFDKGLMELQKKVETIITKIERNPSNPSATYDSEDYELVRKDLNILRTRAVAWEKNEVSVKMIYELGYQLLVNPPTPITEKEAKNHKVERIIMENSVVPMPTQKYFPLQERHSMEDSLGVEDIRDLRILLEIHFQRLIRFENLKKRDK